MPEFRQRGAEIDRCGRFTDATFLIRKRNDSHEGTRQMILPCGLNETKFFESPIWDFRITFCARAPPAGKIDIFLLNI